jgi:hypothetical protein
MGINEVRVYKYGGFPPTFGEKIFGGQMHCRAHRRIHNRGKGGCLNAIIWQPRFGKDELNMD